MPEAEKKPYEDQYQKDKAAYEEWKQSEEGKAALAKQKSMKDSAKEDDSKGANKRGASAGNADDKESLAKKIKTVATPNKGRRPSAKGKPAETQLSEAILAKCASMGTAGSGVSYQTLLEKLIASDGLADVDQ